MARRSHGVDRARIFVDAAGMIPDLTILADDALIIVDPQNDFCPGGSLAVEGGGEIMSGIAALATRFAHVVVTQDWHPANHSSFASNHPDGVPFATVQMSYGDQVLWPDHCIQGTTGAQFHRDVTAGVDRAQLIVRKGFDPALDSYSAFYENDKRTPTGLAGYLRDKRIRRGVFVGLAFDFCVAWSALDAVRDGFAAVVLTDLTRAIAMPLPGGDTTATAAKAALTAAGVELF
jgi:nicotinamidase/pyrazinamidase